MDIAQQRVEKRNRRPVCCEPCRGRKLKCNRQLPCDTCIRRNCGSSCHFAANAQRNKASLPAPNTSSSLNDRLRNIEQLVSSLIETPSDGQSSSIKIQESPIQRSDNPNASTHLASPTKTSSDKPATPGTEGLRVVHDQNGEEIYTDPSNWMSILQEIQLVRENLESSPPEVAPHANSIQEDLDISLVLGSCSTISIPDAITSLPAQPICDMLLSNYFNSRYMVLGIVHYGSFRKEYETFWKQPQQTTFRFLSLLFSILCLAVTFYDKANPTNDSTQNRPSAIILQQTTARCLISGGQGATKGYSIESLFLYLQSRFMNETSSTTQLWLELGTIIRLALRMGYHRDPDSLRNISVFEGEMRRRTWLHIFQIDALVSFQMGLPSGIPTEHSDTKPPGNYLDTDLAIDMDHLPPRRDLQEATPMRYGLVKSRIMRVFKKIVNATHPIASPEYHTILALDKEMKDVYETIPDILKRRDMSDSFMDPSDIILERCTLELLYLKGIVVLHRRYIRHEPENAQFDPSRRFCLEAALEILARQADIYKASLAGGRLHEDRWMITALTEHDFLLASMVVCLDLSIQIESQTPEIAHIEGSGSGSFTAKKFYALQVSQQIWAAKRSSLPESHVASLAIDLMVRKVMEKQTSVQNYSYEISSGMDPWMGAEFPHMETMSNMIDGAEIDWSLLDQLFQNQVMEPV